MASDAQHTPGPWIIEWEYCECGGEYPCGHSDYPHSIVAPNKRVKVGRYEQPFVVVSLLESYNGEGNYDEAESDANARLIVAAPDLLEILERIVQDDLSDMRKSLYDKALATIAKARGE